MNILIEDKDFLQDTVLGSYDNLILQQEKGISCENVHSVIFKWNCEHVRDYINAAYVQSGIEFTYQNRIFVIAPNPKLNRVDYPWRCTFYTMLSGPLCEELYRTLEEAIVGLMVSYPDAKLSNGLIDSYVAEFRM
jgi:hypothetical protein